LFSPGMVGTAGTSSRYAAMAERDLDREIEAIATACAVGAPLDRAELRRRVAGVGWGPGRFRAALRVTIDEGRASRLADGRYSRPRGPVAVHDAPTQPR
jgi:hypothetical protein